MSHNKNITSLYCNKLGLAEERITAAGYLPVVNIILEDAITARLKMYRPLFRYFTSKYILFHQNIDN